MQCTRGARRLHAVCRVVHVFSGFKRVQPLHMPHYLPLQYQPCPLHAFLLASLLLTPDQMVIECLPPSR